MPPFQRISAWAQLHPKKSRFIIAIATILSVFLHYYSGLYLFAYEVIIPYSLAIGGIVIGVIAALLYPIKHQKKGLFAYSYRKQKTLDFLIFMIGGLLVMFLANQRAVKVFAESETNERIAHVIDSNETSGSSIYLPVSERSKSTKTPDFALSRSEMRKQIKSSFKEFKKAIRKEIRSLRKQRKKGEKRDGSNALLTFLTILGALALGLFVSALACSLSCNGNELAAGVVLIVGWAGIILLSFFIIKKIFGREKNRTPQPKNKDDSYPY